jgi:hypothetical protein
MKKIHQIWISDRNAPADGYVANQMQRLKHMYSDYEYTLYDNEMCRDQIRSLLGEEAVRLYDSLNSYAFRADLARYCILYQHGGYYFDSVICPEFKLEFDNFPVLYLSPNGECYGYRGIDNGVMYFNKQKHPFLRDALKLCLKNIHQQLYGVNTLDITGPVMLGRLKETYDIRFGKSKVLNPQQKAAYFDGIVHWLYNPTGSSLQTFGCDGINLCEQMWLEKCVFKSNKIKFVSFYTADYEQDAEELKNSLIEYGFDASDVNYRERVGSWAANTQMKAPFILEKLRKYDAVIWTDADSIIVDTPDIFDTITADVGFYFISKDLVSDWNLPAHSILKNVDSYLQSGTMFFKSNERVIKLLESWIELNKRDSSQWDQWTLQAALETSDVTVAHLPPEYYWTHFVARSYPDRKPIILHTQASERKQVER